MSPTIIRNTFSEKGILNLSLYGPWSTNGPWQHYASNKQTSKDVCYEITWISGDAFLCFGYASSDPYSIIYYLYIGNPYIIFNNVKNSQDFGRKQVSFIIQKSTPTMICISLNKRMLTMIQNEQSQDFTFIDSYEPKTVGAYMHPGSSGNYNDYVSVNFGSYPFKNPLPTGYLPFAYSEPCYTQMLSIRINTLYTFIYILLLI